MSVHPSNRKVTVPNERSNPINANQSKFQKILLVIIPIVVIVILIIYIIRQDSNSKTIVIQENTGEEREKIIFNDCIDIIWENLLNHHFNQSNPEHLQPIRIKVFNTIRRLTSIYKRDLILFLYERGFIRTDIPSEQQLHLHGTDLNNIQFENVNLEYLYLPGVIALNSRFSNCQLKKSNFQGSVMDNTRFISCSLEESTFSDASLKQSSFTSITSLSTINFNNADLLASQIDTNELNNKKLTVNTRLPDGSFPNIDPKNLINDGGAEQQCNTSRTDHWLTESTYPSLTIADRVNNSCIAIRSVVNNKCFFQTNITGRLIQDIDLTRYSTLIDSNQTWFNVSAYMGCANATSGDSSTVEVRFANERKIYGNYPAYVLKSGKSWKLSRNDSFIPIGTRTIRIMIGATIRNPSACCAIDDVQFNILQKTEANNAFI